MEQGAKRTQLQVMSQKAQFFEPVVDVLKKDSIVKRQPGKSSPKASRRAEHRQDLPVSRHQSSGLLQA